LGSSLSNLVPEAHILTFAYKPLVGVTSQTDPNGVTTYCEYDSFGRLKCTKDDDGNILKQYDYNYAE
jgi:YD repeat-containing protein